jgi:hypothetical protein
MLGGRFEPIEWSRLPLKGAFQMPLKWLWNQEFTTRT